MLERETGKGPSSLLLLFRRVLSVQIPHRNEALVSAAEKQGSQWSIQSGKDSEIPTTDSVRNGKGSNRPCLVFEGLPSRAVC